MSVKTPMLATTPEPHGRPGGPGLYKVKGNKHSDYFEHIVGALMRDGMSEAKASAIAWHALRRWRAGLPSSGSKRSRSGRIHPEVRAAASSALAEEEAARAKAHNHSNTVSAQLELAGLWRGLGRGKGWKYVGPQQSAAPMTRSAAKAHAAFASFGTGPGQANSSLVKNKPKFSAPETSGSPKARAAMLRAEAEADRRKAAAITQQIQQIRISLHSTAAASAAAKKAAKNAANKGVVKKRTKRATHLRKGKKPLATTSKSTMRRKMLQNLYVKRRQLLNQARHLDAEAQKLDPQPARRN